MSAKNLTYLLIGLGLAAISGQFAYGLIYYVYSASSSDDYPFYSSFERGDLSEWNRYGAQQLCCDHSVEIVTEPVRSGSYAVKLTVKPSDPNVKKSKRAELGSKPPSKAANIGTPSACTCRMVGSQKII